MSTVVVGARVAPRIAAGRLRVLSLARRARRYLERLSGERIPGVNGERLEIIQSVYAGAYGRALPGAEMQAERLNRATGLELDGTYSAKAFSAACSLASQHDDCTLFWLTFDGRIA
jgi:1-aminocyclopropane-1-carboxylate deaminase/D-cysteine desulfhydrase-like pyridoxal-dependent ACC family enzyme